VLSVVDGVSRDPVRRRVRWSPLVRIVMVGVLVGGGGAVAAADAFASPARWTIIPGVSIGGVPLGATRQVITHRFGSAAFCIPGGRCVWRDAGGVVVSAEFDAAGRVRSLDAWSAAARTPRAVGPTSTARRVKAAYPAVRAENPADPYAPLVLAGRVGQQASETRFALTASPDPARPGLAAVWRVTISIVASETLDARPARRGEVTPGMRLPRVVAVWGAPVHCSTDGLCGWALIDSGVYTAYVTVDRHDRVCHVVIINPDAATPSLRRCGAHLADTTTPGQPPASGLIRPGVGIAGLVLGASLRSAVMVWGVPESCSAGACAWRRRASSDAVSGSVQIAADGRITDIAADTWRWHTAAGARIASRPDASDGTTLAALRGEFPAGCVAAQPPDTEPAFILVSGLRLTTFTLDPATNRVVMIDTAAAAGMPGCVASG
jgi:hypothetical protein